MIRAYLGNFIVPAFLIAVAIAGLFGLGLMLGSCAQPTPRPTAFDAGPSDLFTAKIFNCRLDVVAIERDSAVVDVGRCLLGHDRDYPDPPACLVHQAGQYKPDTVVCVTRDMGAAANAAVLAGSTDPDDATIANVVRDWIRSERMGLR